jgi:hypothetical protein
VRTHAKQSTYLRFLTITGSLTFLGYIAYFVLMQSHSLWQAPSLAQDRWKEIFYPISGLFPADWVRPPFDSPVRPVVVASYLLLLFALFGIYLWAVRRSFRTRAVRVEEAPVALRRITGFTVAALLVLLVVPGVLSTDLFSYAWYGRIVAVFGDNPFTHVPADYVWHDSGKWLQWVFWKETPSAYGPAWVMLAGVIADIAQALGGDIAYHVVGHKVLASLAHVANILLIWKVAGIVISRYWARPEAAKESDWHTGARVAVTLAYAWNPLVMLEIGANGHNDVLLLTGMLAALWLHLLGRWRLACVAFALATLMKFNMVLFIPGYMWLLLWEAAPGGLRNAPVRRLWRLTQAVGLMLVTAVLFYLPFWAGPATLKHITAGPFAELSVNSFGYLVRYKLPEISSHIAAALGWQPHDMWATDAIGRRLEWPSRWGPILIFAVFALLKTWHARTFPRMLSAWGWMTFVYLTVGAVWFWPWYVTWLVPIVALMGPGRLFVATQILCIGSMTMYAAVWRSNTTFMEWADYKPLVMVGLPLLYVMAAGLFGAIRRARSEHPNAVSDTHPSERLAHSHGPLVPAPARIDNQERTS